MAAIARSSILHGATSLDSTANSGVVGGEPAAAWWDLSFGWPTPPRHDNGARTPVKRSNKSRQVFSATGAPACRASLIHSIARPMCLSASTYAFSRIDWICAVPSPVWRARAQVLVSDIFTTLVHFLAAWRGGLSIYLTLYDCQSLL